MDKIGLIIAVEMESFLKVFDKYEKKKKIGSFNIYEYSLKKGKLIVCESGAGEIASAAATQLLISLYEVSYIINFGVAGGLKEEIRVFDNCLVENVVHYDYDITSAGNYKLGQYMFKNDIYFETDKKMFSMVKENFPLVKVVNCASGDKFITEKEKRTIYGEKFNCQICEMEAAGILITCRRNEIPCLIIKSISDSVDDGAEAFCHNIDEASKACFKIIEEVINMIFVDK